MARTPTASSPAAELAISDVCAHTALSPRTVRYYEELGLLPGVRRRNGSRRVYGQDELERLRFIKRLKALGLSLAEIKELNAVHAIGGSTVAMLVRLDTVLGARISDLDGRICELEALRDDMSKYRNHVCRRTDTLQKGDEPPAVQADADAISSAANGQGSGSPG